MVKRFNGGIAEVLRTHRIHSNQNLETTLLRYIDFYNHPLPQKPLGHTPLKLAAKDWQESHPHLFHKSVYYLAGLDI